MSSRADADVTRAGLRARGYPFRRVACGALCCVASSSFSLAALAEDAPSPLAAPTALGNFPKKLAITVVADEHLLETFQQRVSSWFSDGTEVRVTVTSEVDEQGLLASSPTEVRAWIVPLSDERALLTFSSVIPPDAPRHLVREVRLRQGFDELGLERLASVTHSAFVALREGVEGVERAQAERELGAAGVAARSAALPSEPAGLPAPAAASPAPPPTTPIAVVARSAPEPSAALLIAAGYGVRFRGAEGTGHGPSLALGVQLPSGRTAYDLQLSAQYLFRSEFEASPFSASVQTTALRVHFGLEPWLQSSFFGQAMVGLGADLARISASAASSSSDQALVSPRANGTQWRGAAELTLGILRRGELLDVGVYAQASFLFADVHYNATSGAGEAVLVRPWRLQPAIGIQGRFRGAL